MARNVEADIVIVGGGIAGLWMLNRLRQQKYNAILLESDVLGGGQTHKSQGIIHGGMKFAAGGFAKAATAIADMPALWSDCLNGKGEIDLQGVPLLSAKQYLWSPPTIAGKLTGLLAGVALRTKVHALSRDAYPDIFKHPQFEGDVYAVDEMVIDVHRLIRELVKPHQDAIFKIDPISEENIHLDLEGNITAIDIHTAVSNEAIPVKAQRFIFAAGQGNETLLNKLGSGAVSAQRRPLHMVYVKLPQSWPLYGHCLNMGTTPRITITTHQAKDGSSIWYLGGLLSEVGVDRSSEEQIAAAKSELHDLFPWLDFSQAQFGTCRIDRAEPLQANGGRPDSCLVKPIRNALVAWPTKLALAPKLAEEVMKILEQAQIQARLFDTRELRACPMPPFAQPLWDNAIC